MLAVKPNKRLTHVKNYQGAAGQDSQNHPEKILSKINTPNWGEKP